MNKLNLFILLAILLCPVLASGDYNITGYCVRTDTGQVMVGGWGPGFNPSPGVMSWDFSGMYTITLPAGYNGIATPSSSMPGTFNPPYRTYTNLNANLSNQSYTFTPVTFSISGRVTRADTGAGVSNVTFTNLTGNAVTDAGGYYSGNVVSGWSGTVTPTHSLLGVFAPASYSYSNVTSNQVNQNYVWTENIMSISGTITNADTGQPLPGVTLHNLTGNPQTDSLGFYTAIVPQGFTAAVVPYIAVAGTFSPVNRVYINVISSFTGQDYSWSALTYTVSGRITSAQSGSGIGGISFTGFDENPVTDDDGYYIATVPWGFTSSVIPVHPQGGSFTPSGRNYNHLTANSTNQNYQWSSTAAQDDYTPAAAFSICPNPFQSQVNINCTLDKTTPLCIEIYDLKGRMINRISHENYPAGSHSLLWNGSDSNNSLCPNGIYFCRITTGTNLKTLKLVLLR